MNLRGRAVLLAVAVTLTGCRPYIGSCGWVVPEAGASIRVVEARKPTSAECNCMNCDAPGRFLIQRDDYTVELWNGDRWYPELYVRALDKNGRALALSSSSPDLVKIAPHVPKSATDDFEYFVAVAQNEREESPKSLSIDVVDADGRVLGVETVGLRMEFRKDLGMEGL